MIRTGGSLALVATAVALTGCTGDVDLPWQLAHDRIVAVRATPPHVPAGEVSHLDVLLAFKEAPTAVRPPDQAQVVSPTSLADTLAADAGGWAVTAPDEARLASARTELGLASDAPVPLVVGVSSGGLFATKTVYLGDSADNPELAGLTVDGASPPDELAVGEAVDVRLAVEADDATDIVNWLTSCGTMHDFDLSKAYLRVEPEDPHEGELAVVLRDPAGGVAWRVWPIHAP